MSTTAGQGFQNTKWPAVLFIGHLVFSTPWPAVELKKVLSVTKHRFVFLRSIKHFRAGSFLDRNMIVWFSWICWISEIYWKDRTAGHLVFWKPWPARSRAEKSISVVKHGFVLPRHMKSDEGLFESLLVTFLVKNYVTCELAWNNFWTSTRARCPI